MKKVPQQSVLAEARLRMAADMERFLPKRLRVAKGKWKFGLGLALIELVVLVVGGKFIYDWFQG